MSLIGRLLGEPSVVQPPLEYYLRDQNVPFSLHHHPPAYSAQQLAQIEHVPGRMVAKVVIVVADNEMMMLCLPAPCRVDFFKVMDVLGTDAVRPAEEKEFAKAFPDCELGAMPPLGNLYKMPVYVDRRLTANSHIVFQAGTHTDTVDMFYADFASSPTSAENPFECGGVPSGLHNGAAWLAATHTSTRHRARPGGCRGVV
jgi:Ala-tRNA(Pro) deacylase